MLADTLSNFVGIFAAFVLGASLCTLIEFLFASEEQSAMSRVRGFFFSLISLAAAVLATDLTKEFMAQAGLRPLIHWDLASTIHSSNLFVVSAGYTVIPLFTIFLYDFGYYWFHRLQHTVPLLWRYHAVHHSIEELNSFNSYHHVSEYFFRIPLLTVPINLLFSISEPQVIVTGVIIGAVGKLAHANTRICFGPLRYLFVEPRFHRVHHSVEERHWNRNYAFYFPLLDIVFRTAHFPSRNECPRTGVNYAREPRNLRMFLFPPEPPEADASREAALSAAEQPSTRYSA